MKDQTTPLEPTPLEPTPLETAPLEPTPLETAPLATIHYEADMGGIEEVNGVARFNWIDNRQLYYSVQVSNLPHITAVRLRTGSSSGPVVAYVYGPVQGTTVRSLSTSGYLYSADLIGPLRGKPLSALVQEMNNGNVWVDVATTEQPAGAIDGRVYRKRS